jgi:CheY-like chemotaxis protein
MALQQKKPTQQSAARAGAPRGRILVVEDHRDSRDGLRLLLECYGYEVEAVQDGPAAVEAAHARAPVVALVDLQLPHLSGLDVAKALREQLHDRVWLVALTALDSRDDRERSAAAGFDFHVTKPVQADELHNLVDTVMLQR